MNAYMNKSAYGQTHQMTVKGRDAEAEALIKAARLLDEARQDTADPSALVRALDFNTKLWTVFQADLSEPDHPMPKALKSRMLSLSLYVDQQTARALKSRDASCLQCLIEINRNIGQGLLTMNRAKQAH